MKNNKFIIGIDIGGTNTKVGLFSSDGSLVKYFSLKTDKNTSSENFIKNLSDQIHLELSTLSPIGKAQIVGVGVGAPMANYFSGKIDFASNLGWKDVPLKNYFEKYLKTQVVIENDANLAAIGEKKWGAGKDLNHFILITLGTGVGTGLILNGQLHRGHMSRGGEGGHILIPSDQKRKCSCGGVNHLESFLGASGIRQTIEEITGEDWSLEKFNQEIKINNPLAIRVLEKISQELALGMVSMSVLTGVESFILGGGISKLGEIFNQMILNKFNELVHFSLKNNVSIKTSLLSSDKGAIYGGAALVLEEFAPK